MKRSRPNLENWREFVGTAWHDDSSSEWLVDDVSLPSILGQSVHVVTPDAVSVVPANYEPRYAYPLIVWLCGTECRSPRALEHIVSLSPQNYVGLAIEDATMEFESSEGSVSGAFVTHLERLAQIERTIVDTVRAFREMVHVHSERIYLVGVGEAASTALLVGIHEPDWFAGCVAFGGEVPPLAQLFAERGSLRGKRFWLSHETSPRNQQAGPTMHAAARMLIASGADVTARSYPGAKLVTPNVLRDIDDWLISGILSNA